MSLPVDQFELDTADVGMIVDPLEGLEFERPIQPVGRSVTDPTSRPHRTGGQSERILYLDIETIPDEERMHLFGLDPLPEVPPETTSASCPAPETFLALGLEQMERELLILNPDDAFLELLIAEEGRKPKPRAGVAGTCKKVKSRKYEVAGAAAARNKELGTTPEFCRIVAVGWAFNDGEANSCVIDTDDLSVGESRILKGIWDSIRIASQVVGFNCLSFDFRTILFRSAFLGVEPTKLLNLSPWNSRDIVDLQVVRYGSAIPGKGRGLKWLARMNGIAVPTEGIDGSDVQILFATDREKLGEYVRSDVTITRELHRRWQGYFCA